MNSSSPLSTPHSFFTAARRHTYSPVLRRRLFARLAEHVAIDSYPAELRREVECAVGSLARMRPLPVRASKPRKRAGHELPETAPRLIALYGKGRSGKTTLAEFIEHRYDNVAHFGFSTPMCAEVNALLEGSGHELDDHNKAHPNYRTLLQAWGQARRHEHPDYWITRMQERVVAAHADGARLVVLAGLREPREKDAVEAWGGEVWKIVRPTSNAEMPSMSNQGSSALSRALAVVGEVWRIVRPTSNDEISIDAATHRNETALDHLDDGAFARVLVNGADGYLPFLDSVRDELEKR